MIKPLYKAKQLKKAQYTSLVQSVTHQATLQLKNVSLDAYQTRPFVVNESVFLLTKSALQQALSAESIPC